MEEHFGASNGEVDTIVDMDEERGDQKSEYPIWDEEISSNYVNLVGTIVVDASVC